MFLFFSSSLSGLTVSLSLPLSLTVSPSLLLGLIVSTQQSNPPPATSHHNSNDHHNDQRPTLIKSMTHANETDQVNDPRQSTRRSTPVTSMIHKRRPMNPKPWTQTHELRLTKSLEHIVEAHQTKTHDHCRSTLIGEAQREKREERSERGKRKIEERAVKVNKKEFFFYNPATMWSQIWDCTVVES